MPVELYKLNPPPRVLQRRAVCSPFGNAVLCALGALWIMAPVHVAASDQGPSLGVEASEVLIETQVDRRVELKRTLLTSGDLPQSDARRSLSLDERDALNRELREAISGLYEQRAEERARNRASP